MAQLLNDTALCLYNVSLYISECSYCIITMGICMKGSVYDTTKTNNVLLYFFYTIPNKFFVCFLDLFGKFIP